MSNKKYHVFFRRVSTAGQDLSMQESADAPFREKLLPDEIITIVENAISANKKSIQERPEMQKVISLIRQGKVHTLYAFDRTRLFRDYYEAMEFNEIRTVHEVELIFTSIGNGNIPANDSVFLEGILNLFSDVEGKNIARRSEEARRMYPASKLGYKKIKETKYYCKDPAKQELISQYFSSLLEISTIEEFGEVLKRFKKIFKRSDIVLINLARDSFYAGYDLSRGENKLPHVESYLSLETFNRIQQTMENIIDSYLNRLQQLEKQNIYKPLCGFCHSPMRYKIDDINNVGFYLCSRNHKKVSIAFKDISNIVQSALHQVISHLDSKSLLNHSISRFREIQKQITTDVQAVEYQITEIMENIILNSEPNTGDWKNNPQYKKLTGLKKDKDILLDELAEKESFFQDNRAAFEVVKKFLDNRLTDNPSLLYAMFINKILVHPNDIDIEVRLFDYLNDIQTDYVYIGDEIG